MIKFFLLIFFIDFFNSFTGEIRNTIEFIKLIFFEFIKNVKMIFFKNAYFFLLGGIVPQITNSISNITIGFNMISNLQFNITEITFYFILLLIFIMEEVKSDKFIIKNLEINSFSEHIFILFRVKLFVMGMNSNFFYFFSENITMNNISDNFFLGEDSWGFFFGVDSEWHLLLLLLLPFLITIYPNDYKLNNKNLNFLHNEPIYSNRENLKNTLKKILLNDENSMILIKGKWGIGKSYFINNFFKENNCFLKLEINAMTFDNKVSLSKEVFIRLGNILKSKSIETNSSNEINRYIENLFGTVSLPIFSFKKEKKDFNALKGSVSNALQYLDNIKIILVIENLERIIDLEKINNLLSFLHEIEDIENLKTIVVADEERLLTKLDENYIQKFFMEQLEIGHEELNEILYFESKIDEQTKEQFLESYNIFKNIFFQICKTIDVNEKQENEKQENEKNICQKFIKSFLNPRNVLKVINDYEKKKYLEELYELPEEKSKGIIFLTLGLKEFLSYNTSQCIYNLNGLESFLQINPNIIDYKERLLIQYFCYSLRQLHDDEKVTLKLASVIFDDSLSDKSVKVKVESINHTCGVSSNTLNEIITYYKYFGNKVAKEKFKYFYYNMSKGNMPSDILNIFLKNHLAFNLFSVDLEIKNIFIETISNRDKDKLMDNLIKSFYGTLNDGIGILEFLLKKSFAEKEKALNSFSDFFSFLKTNLKYPGASDRNFNELDYIENFICRDFKNEVLNNQLKLFFQIFKNIYAIKNKDLLNKENSFLERLEEIGSGKKSNFRKSIIILKNLYNELFEDNNIKHLDLFKKKVSTVLNRIDDFSLSFFQEIPKEFFGMGGENIEELKKYIIQKRNNRSTEEFYDMYTVQTKPKDLILYSNQLFSREKDLILEILDGKLNRGLEECLPYLGCIVFDIIEDYRLEELLNYIKSSSVTMSTRKSWIEALEKAVFEYNSNLLDLNENVNKSCKKIEYLWAEIENNKYGTISSDIMNYLFFEKSLKFVIENNNFELLKKILKILIGLKKLNLKINRDYLEEIKKFTLRLKIDEDKLAILFDLFLLYKEPIIIEEILLIYQESNAIKSFEKLIGKFSETSVLKNIDYTKLSGKYRNRLLEIISDLSN